MLPRSLYKSTDKKALMYSRVLWGLRRGVSNIASGRRGGVKLGIHFGIHKECSVQEVAARTRKGLEGPDHGGLCCGLILGHTTGHAGS